MVLISYILYRVLVPGPVRAKEVILKYVFW